MKNKILIFGLVSIMILANFGCIIVTDEKTNDNTLYGNGWTAEIEDLGTTNNQMKFVNLTNENITSLKILSVTPSGSPLTSTEPTWSSQTNRLPPSIAPTATSSIYTINSGSAPLRVNATNQDYIWFKAENSSGNKYVIGAFRWEQNTHTDLTINIKEIR